MSVEQKKIDSNKQTEPKQTEIDTSALELPKMGYGKDFENKLLTFISRGTFESKPSDMEMKNPNIEDLLNEAGNLQRWYGVLDKEYSRTMADKTETKVTAIQLTKVQNDRLTQLDTSEKTLDEMFAEGLKAKLVCCKTPSKSGGNVYWNLLTVNQYKERFGKDPIV